MKYETPCFLIVDDDAVCVMAIKRMIKTLRLLNPIRVAENGIEALEVLRGTADQPPLESPYIVILDINMPKMTGHEFLHEIRNDKDLSQTVVFMMSTSDAASDIEEAYGANVAGYIVKNDTPESFRAALNMLDAYSEVVLLPSENNPAH